jgi:hypothetical protein
LTLRALKKFVLYCDFLVKYSLSGGARGELSNHRTHPQQCIESGKDPDMHKIFACYELRLIDLKTVPEFYVLSTVIIHVRK